MKILVCISHVPDTTSKINFTDDNTRFDTNGVQFVINPHDEYSLTRAMFFKERQGASVTVAGVGTAAIEPTLRKALAIGADEAIRVNAEPSDAFFVASQLAEVIKKGEYDIILAGRESIDSNGNSVPGMTAAILGYNFINAVNSLEAENGKAVAVRDIDGGKETLEADLPVIIGAQKIVLESELKIPNMRGIMMARKKPLHVVEPVTSEAYTQVVKFEKPAPKSDCKIVETVDELVDLLHNEAKIF